jgi:nitrous oxide reductase accessory protein NosL
MRLFSLFLLSTLLLAVEIFAYPNYSDAIKEKKIYPLGKNIYEKRCSSIKPSNYNTFSALEDAIKNDAHCKKLQTKYQEALALYLWEKVRITKKDKKYPEIVVTHKDKCPVCGMFLYKYPRWVSMIEYSNGKKLYFDGLKDLFKYYFEDPKDIKGLFTRDYYTQETIALKDAYFVLGSDVYGPMGNELIAFKDKKSAQNFFFDHRGKKIVNFKEITKSMVYKLDE